MEAIVVFVVIIIISSLFRKLKEKADADNQPRVDERGELPEATRRILYGDDDVPQQAQQGSIEQIRGANLPGSFGPEGADTRRPAPAAPAVPAAPVRPVIAQRPAPAPPPMPRQQPQAAAPAPRPQQASPQDVFERLRGELVRQVQQAQGVPQSQPQQSQPQQSQPQQRQPQQQRSRPVQAPKPQPQRPRPAAPKQQPARTPQAPQAPPTVGFAPYLFSSKEDVRRGIIMSEILGPPKALQ